MTSEYSKRPNAARVSEAVAKFGLEKHNADKENAGYRCSQWVEDEYGNPTVRVEWFMGSNPDVGVGRKYEGRVAAARRAKLREIMEHMIDDGYATIWGWDPSNGDPDTNFVVVISPESAAMDAQRSLEGVEEEFDEEEFEEVDEVEFEEVDEEGTMSRLDSMRISYKEANEAALAVNRAYNIGRDEVARRLEHRLMASVLAAIVYGTDEPVDLAAAALSTQHLPFAR